MNHNSIPAKSHDCNSCPMRERSLLRDVEKQSIDEVMERKHCNVYRKGDVIFHEGNYPMGLFCIFSGKIKLYKTNEQGKEQIIRLAKSGDPLGYRSLIANETYQMAAEALEDSRICFIPKSTFDNLVKQTDKVFPAIMQLMSSELKMAEKQLAAMASKTVRERTAEAILLLKNFFGLKADGKTIDVMMSREDLAGMVGTATESLIRMLSEFKNDHIIELVEKRIVILDMKKLQSTANLFD